MVQKTDLIYETNLDSVPPGNSYGKNLDNAFEVYMNQHHLRVTGESEDGYSLWELGSSYVNVNVEGIELGTGADTDGYAYFISTGHPTFATTRNITMRFIGQVNSVSDINVQISIQVGAASAGIDIFFRDGEIRSRVSDGANSTWYTLQEYDVDTKYTIEVFYNYDDGYIKYKINGTVVFIADNATYLPHADYAYAIRIYIDKTTQTDVDDKVFTLNYYSITEDKTDA